jgi:hypothetical protein
LSTSYSVVFLKKKKLLVPIESGIKWAKKLNEMVKRKFPIFAVQIKLHLLALL